MVNQYEGYCVHKREYDKAVADVKAIRGLKHKCVSCGGFYQDCGSYVGERVLIEALDKAL